MITFIALVVLASVFTIMFFRGVGSTQISSEERAQVEAGIAIHAARWRNRHRA